MNTIPAFPGSNPNNEREKHLGMTLLDYFAARALQGYLSAPNDTISQSSGPNARANPSMVAEWAYKNAEAMMQYREHIEWT